MTSSTTPTTATPPTPATDTAYTPQRRACSRFLDIRGLRLHCQVWGDPAADAAAPPLFMLHGWMDVGASFQFAVDALKRADGFDRCVLAPDWRGFGLSAASGVDSYWFPDYLGDLEALLDALAPAARWPQIDLLGHSMGGNVAMTYAGLRPSRIRRLVNLEGFGQPEGRPEAAAPRLRQWLDELKVPQSLKPYDSLQAVAARLMKNNPLLPADKAAWLAPHWAAQTGLAAGDTRWHILGDAAHKRVNPALYRVAEHSAIWRGIEAPVLWGEGDRTDMAQWWGQRYTRTEFETRLADVPRLQRQRFSPCGHMVHHDVPQALAQALAEFLA